MTDVQRRAYENADAVYSDPFGLISRDNRNHQKKQTIIMEQTRAQPGDAVLEVGCGHGLHTERYARHFEMDAIDLSHALVAETAARVPDATVCQMDARQLDYPDDRFAAVVGTAILHHLADPAAALAEWLRVTKPGGSVTLMEPNVLFPKDLLFSQFIPEERHKINMLPWRLERTLDAVADEWRLEPRLYTPPWPGRAAPLFDRIDSWAAGLPGAEWVSQMLLIHVEVP